MSFQQLILVGNLGNDPEMRYTPSGVPVTSFSLAVSRSWTDQTGQRQEKTTWFRVTCWQKLAETVSQYATKGRQVMVVGELEEARMYQDRENNTKVSLEVRANTVRFLGNRADGGGESSYSGGSERQVDGAPSRNGGASAGGSSSAGGAKAPMHDAGHPSDEDIPF